jgi:hypothetical protein
MHFHLPKPLHGWREFVGEVGIIVIGVLIALGFEQVAQSIHDRRLAEETRSSIRQELQTGLASLSFRRDAEPCVGRRLNEVREVIDGWGRTGSFKTPRWIGAPPRLGVSLPRYEAASAAGRLALLSSDEQFRFGTVVTGLRTFRDTQVEEASEWAKLRELSAGPEALSATDRSVIRAAMQEASMLDFNMKLGTGQFLALAADYGLHPDVAAFHARAKLTWKTGRFEPTVCSAINTPPAVATANSIVPLPE